MGYSDLAVAIMSPITGWHMALDTTPSLLGCRASGALRVRSLETRVSGILVSSATNLFSRLCGAVRKSRHRRIKGTTWKPVVHSGLVQERENRSADSGYGVGMRVALTDNAWLPANRPHDDGTGNIRYWLIYLDGSVPAHRRPALSF